MTATADGRSLELYFIEGKPDGMLTAEVFNWTGHVLMTPRTQIGAALLRKEARFTGVYILLGEQEGEPYAYIGEGEDISYRIRTHEQNKDWWTTAVLVVSAANSLNKAHSRYLEARLIEEARQVRRVTLTNGTTPARLSLSEAAQSNMEAFLGYLFMVLPALRIDMFIKNTRPSLDAISAAEGSPDLPRFKLNVKKHELEATAVLRDGEFIVEAGSMARVKWEGKGSEKSSYALLHDELLKIGVLRVVAVRAVFTQNYAFKSLSAAASVVAGRPANGPTSWKLADGSRTYQEWEELLLEKAVEQNP